MAQYDAPALLEVVTQLLKEVEKIDKDIHIAGFELSKERFLRWQVRVVRRLRVSQAEDEAARIEKVRLPALKSQLTSVETGRLLRVVRDCKAILQALKEELLISPPPWDERTDPPVWDEMEGAPDYEDSISEMAVFISHSTIDRVRVESEIVSLLQGKGIGIWYSKDDIVTAEVWERSIREGLKRCEWFLVAVSPNAIKSEWVHREVHWALDRRAGRVVVVLLEPCDPADLHLGLDRIQYADFTKDVVEGQKRLLKTWGLEYEQPLGPGITPNMEIVGGVIRYEKNSWGSKQLEMNVPVDTGTIGRGKDGRLRAQIRSIHPFIGAQELLEKLGLDSFNLVSEDTVTSIDPSNPTEFSDRCVRVIPAGTMVTDFKTGVKAYLPSQVKIVTETYVSGYLDGRKFKGRFTVSATYSTPQPPLNLSGTFDVRLG